MDFKKLGWILLLISVNFATAQVKIGENPNTINGASIVELESTDKALVLTRVSTSQMQSIVPLHGAMVYNTDTQCIHYFNGGQWNNLCDGSGKIGSFSFVDNGNGTYTLNDGDGGTITFNGAAETTSTLVDNFDGTYTYTNEEGNQTLISFSATDNQNLESATIDGNDILTIAIENGNDASVDLSGYDTSVQTSANATDITDLQNGQATQDAAIALNTAKTGITPAQATVIANTSGTNTGDQDISGIAVNATNIATNVSDITDLQNGQVTQNAAIALNTAKTGITPAQATVIANTSGTNTGDQDISGIAVNATNIATNVSDIGTNATDITDLQNGQATQDAAIALNTAKTGITPAQATVIANTSGTNTGDQDISGIATNATDIATNVSDITDLQNGQATQDAAIALNTAKTGITPAQATVIANTSGTNTGDQDISGIATNATDIATNVSDITDLQNGQATQDAAIALNTAKTGITPAQATVIANTSGTNTGDQDISGIATNATDIATNVSDIGTNATDITDLQNGQATQDAAIALNTAKTGITPAQATVISNTSGTNTGDQDISGIAVNATDITDLQNGQATQDAAIALNTAKTGITPAQATVIANTSGTNTGDQDISGIAVNATDITDLQNGQATQDAAIALNTAKTGITPAQATVIANTSGTNTGDQDISGIAVNATDIATNVSDITDLQNGQATQDAAIALNTAKTGITPAQATVISNTSGTNTGDQDISGIAVNATDITDLQNGQATQDAAIALNTAKTGITPAQATVIANTSGTNTGDQDISGIATNATDIATNVSDIGTNATDITDLQNGQATQDAAIALNTAKTGITPAQATVIANTSGTNTGDQDISGIAVNATDITDLQNGQATQDAAIALNTAKTGITPAQATIIANTSGTNTGDQDISGIATNATDITDLQNGQATQDAAIALNTAKTGITPAQATVIANTSGTNTGDQDISGIAVNATDITDLQNGQATQDAAIALNTAKTGITPAQATVIANTTGTNTGDQDISGIAVNATDIATNVSDITDLQNGQATQDAAIALNTAKTGITPAQATVIANTSGTNTGDQDISGIATNATDIATNVSDITDLQNGQATQDAAIALNTAKTGITPAQATVIANTSGTNTGDQDISGIATNSTDIATNVSDITDLQNGQATQDAAIALNTAKTGITPAQATIIANTSGTNTGDQDISGIATNATDIATNVSDITDLQNGQATQDAAIALNTAKTGITPAQATVIANTTGTNTGDQDISGIATNATDIATNVSDITDLQNGQATQDAAIALNTAKTGITPAQATVIANTTGTNTGDQDISGIAVNATDITDLQNGQATQDAAIALNTAKTGITPAQATVIANTSGTNTGDQDISGIATNATDIATNVSDITDLQNGQATQDAAIALNTAKTGITPAQATVIANTSGTNTGDQDISGIAVNATNIATNATDITDLQNGQATQDAAIALNTAKIGITPAQATVIANTSGTNTGDQDISGIATNATDIATNVSDIGTNATDITDLQNGQATQDAAIALNTAKTGITPAQATIIANTSGTNTGDQDISGIATNSTDIATNVSDITDLQNGQATQDAAIALNTAKTGITPAQATIIANTSGTNTGDQDISGIAVNATNIATNVSDITDLQNGQATQDAAIALNTAKTGITPAQATVIANTSGTNTGDQDISGIATNATDITDLQNGQATQDAAIALNTAKTGITPAQATIIANTSGTNTGDQDISGIAVNATNIATNVSDITDLQNGQATQDAAIALNTAKTGITPAQATIIANTSGTNTGDQDISGIATNATDITDLQNGQATQDAAIALNTAKTGITPAQATIIANTSGTNTGDQDISGIATNATDIALKENSANKSTDGTLSGNSDVDFPTEQAVKTYVDTEVGAINTVGAETNNSISAGANGGAFYESPIKAFGKIGSNGSVVRATTGVTSTRLSTGRYRVTLPTGMVSDANYIIQLTQPGRGGAGNDDPGISYSNQTSTSFEVIVGDNDNGGTDRSRFNSEFMFTVLDL
ncbi:beta strand repeat-containing protein [Ulvibacterium sp.]|uniref:beta strand repeat-containing protein n=1 Tax=Ulvibacterium sp. TaxID=2665914 RepID=UPI003CC5A902